MKLDTRPGDLEELAWAVGFFDAEGSFTNAGRYPHVCIGQTDRDPLERFGEAVGTGRINGPYLLKGKDRWSKRPQYYFHAYAQAGVMQAVTLLWPMLGRAKRVQALRMLERAGLPHDLKLLEDRAREAGAQGTDRLELAWAAGFFDGDGCFSYTRASRYPTISIIHTDLELLERFQRAVRAGKIYGPRFQKHDDRRSRKPIYQFQEHGFERVQAVGVLLWTWLGTVKRAQAAYVFNQWPRTCRRGHPKRPGHKACARCTEAYWREYRISRGRSPEPPRLDRAARRRTAVGQRHTSDFA